MKKTILLILLFTIGITAFFSCNNKHDDMVICTMEFRYVNIRVNGGILDTCYTVRLSNSDTIRPKVEMSSITDHNYTVLHDGYQPQLRNRVDSFRFIGLIGQSQVVNEVFVIKADECHIDYVSGRTEVTL